MHALRASRCAAVSCPCACRACLPARTRPCLQSIPSVRARARADSGPAHGGRTRPRGKRSGEQPSRARTTTHLVCGRERETYGEVIAAQGGGNPCHPARLKKGVGAPPYRPTHDVRLDRTRVSEAIPNSPGGSPGPSAARMPHPPPWPSRRAPPPPRDGVGHPEPRAPAPAARWKLPAQDLWTNARSKGASGSAFFIGINKPEPGPRAPAFLELRASGLNALSASPHPPSRARALFSPSSS